MVTVSSSVLAQCPDSTLFDSNGDPFSLDTVIVQCIDDLPDACEPGVYASLGTVNCFPLGTGGAERTAFPRLASPSNGVVGGDAVMALLGSGTDYSDDRFFLPTGGGLRFHQSNADNTVWIEGEIVDKDDPSLVYTVSFYYSSGVAGSVWRSLVGNYGFKNDQGCVVTPAMEDEWIIYLMDEALVSTIVNQSNGTFLTLEHAPSYNTTGLPLWGMQYGTSANNRDCSFGAGAWFKYTGTLDGVTYDSPGLGDLFLTLPPELGPGTCPNDIPEDIGNYPSAIYIYQTTEPGCVPINQPKVFYAADTIEPVFDNCPADITVSCAGDVPAVPTVTATDNCYDGDMVIYQGQFLLDSVGPHCYTMERVWTAKDTCNNDTICTQVITVADITAPSITMGCSADTTVLAVDAACAVNIDTTAAGAGSVAISFSDNCALASDSVYYSDVVTDSTSTGCYTITRTWYAMATDACGNTAMDMCDQYIRIEDNEAPTISLICPADTTLNEVCPVDVDPVSTGDIMVSITDNCVMASSDTTYSDMVTDSTSTGCYTIVRTWTVNATDACGNSASASCTQTITIDDDEAPAISLTCPADTTLNDVCPADVDPASTGDIMLNITDNCVVASSDTSFSDMVTDSTSTGCYTIERTWTVNAMDACGNSASASCTQTITIDDDEAPAISLTCPADTTLNDVCPGDISPSSTGNITVNITDNCLVASSDTSYSDMVTDSTSTGCYTIERTWTVNATDACGNSSSASCTQTITLDDEEAPAISLTCPADTTLNDVCPADIDPANTGDVTVGITDNCIVASSDTSYSDVVTDSTSTGCYTIERTWTVNATDACGNSSSATCTQTITIEDDEAPTWDAYIHYEFIACEDILEPTDPTLIPITASDNCDSVRYEIEVHLLSGGCPGTLMRIWKAIDACGNESELTEQYLQLYDNENPILVLNCPDDYMAEADADCEAVTDTATAGVPTYSVTDVCDDDPESSLSYADSDTMSLCGNTYQFTRTWTLYGIDFCDNDTTETCQQTITIIDNTPPVITAASDLTVECDGAGNTADYNAWIASNAGMTGTDNCGGVTIRDSLLSTTPLCANTRVDTVLFIASDDCGNEASDTAWFKIVDTTPPTIDAAEIDTVNCEDWVCDIDSLIAWGIVSAGDICGDASLTVNCAPFSYSCVGAYNLTYTATDECGLTNTATQVILLEDNEDPTVDLTCPGDLTLYVDGYCYVDISGTVSGAGAATALFDDNCALKSDTLYYNDAVTDSTSIGCYTIERTWTAMATDSCNRTTTETCMQTIMVADTTNPTVALACPGDYNVFVDGNCTADLDPDSYDGPAFEGADNCILDSLSLTYADMVTDSTSEGCYSIVRTWTGYAADDCGNTTTETCSQTIMVMDTIHPLLSLTCPNDTTLYTDADCMVDTTTSSTGMAMASATDNCGSTPDVSLTYVDSEATYTCITAGQPMVINGFTGQYAEANWLVNNNGTNGYATFDGDGSGLAVTGSDEGNTDPGSNTGVTKVCIVASELITVSFDWYWSTQDWGSFWDPGFYINDTRYNLTNGSNLGCCFVGPDESGSLTMVVQAGDLLGFGVESIDGIYGSATLEISNFTVVGSAEQQGVASNSGSYVFTRTWTATTEDDCGNESTASCSQTITVEDDMDPTVSLTCPSDTTVYVDGDCMTDLDPSEIGEPIFSADDNCGLASDTVYYSDAVTDSTSAGCYTIVRTWTGAALDVCGNSATETCTQTITIEDNTAPTVTLDCPADKTLEVDGDCMADLSVGSTGNATTSFDDNCELASDTVYYSDAVTDSTSAGCYTIQRTWTAMATDACGNSATETCTQTITIEDNTAPTVTLDCPADKTLEVDGDCMADLSVGSTGNATTSFDDNCELASDTVYYSDAVTDSTSAGCYTIQRTWTAMATDACGNSATETCTQTITIEDNTAPTVTLDCPADKTLEVDGDCMADLSSTGDATTSFDDNCGLASDTVYYSDAVTDSTSAGCYTIERTWTAMATDDCGNSTSETCTQTITIEDNTAPTLSVTGTDSLMVYLDDACAADISYETIAGLTWEVDENCAMDTIIVEFTDSEEMPICICTEDTIDCPDVDFTTYTMGGWGTHCNGGNPGCYRDANFAAAFPSGVTVGCPTGNTLTLTTSNAVEAFLPCGGTGGMLSGTYIDPYCVGNVLAGQTVAAKLSIGFDDYDPGFGNSSGWLGDVKATTGAYAGWTISEIVDRADSILGGCLLADGSALTSIMTAFNEEFVGGAISNGGWAYDGCENGYIIVSNCDTLTEGSYTVTRNFTITARDACGNENVETYEQLIEVLDTISPQFTNTCGLTNGGTGYVCCAEGDEDGSVDWQSALVCNSIAAEDNCDTEVRIIYEDDFDGDFAPNDYVSSYCMSFVPEAFEDGETCGNQDPHSLRLWLPSGLEDFAGEPGVVENNTDGTWTLTQDVTSIDGTGGGWIVQITYGMAMDWDDWSNQPGSHTFKLDCGEIDDNHEDWDYRILDSGTLIGTGTYFGDTLHLAHAPSNELFGFQLGYGASGQNGNYGFGGWLYYSGMFDGVPANGTGDVFGDLDCCLPWSVTRTWKAFDDCFNETCFSYTVSVNDEVECEDVDGDAELAGSGAGDHTPVILGGAGDLTTGKTPIRVTNLQPNPTNDWSLLGFTVTENMRIRVDMYSMDGGLIAELYDGIASPNVNHTLDIDAADLDAGMYQIRLSSAQYLVVKKLLVSQ